MRCKGCYYDLKNLTGSPEGGHRCPECGRRFDPNDRGTFLAAARPLRPLQHWILFAPSVLCGSATLWVWHTVVNESKGEMFGSLVLNIGFGAVKLVTQWPLTLLASFVFYVLFLIIWLIRRQFHVRG